MRAMADGTCPGTAFTGTCFQRSLVGKPSKICCFEKGPAKQRRVLRMLGRDPDPQFQYTNNQIAP